MSAELQSPAPSVAGTEAIDEHPRVREHLDRQDALPDIHRRLRTSAGVGAMLAQAAESARAECGFERALVLLVSGSELTASGTHALADPASDRLRRLVQNLPVPLERGTREHQLVRGMRRRRAPIQRSLLAERLGLEQYALGAIVPDAHVLALLVVDRPGQPLDGLDRSLVTSLAAMIGVTLEHLILRSRVSEVSMELRSLTSSAQALTSEVLEAPMTIPVEREHSAAFPRQGMGATPHRGRARDLLSDREMAVAELLVQGHSNRDIADELIISPATVKDCIVRIRHKLHAANRVEAATRYLELARLDRRD